MTRALFIGRSVLDVTALLQDFPGPDGKAKALANEVIPGGSALNAAVVFSHLGGEAGLATSLGADGLLREYLTNDLAEQGVSVHDICADPAYNIPVSTVISTISLGTRLVVNGARDECARVHERNDLITDGFDLIQLDQYERHFVSRHHDALRAFKGPIVLDGGGWKSWSPDFLRLADIPIVSEVFQPDGPKDLSVMCAELGIKRWAVTRGKGGVYWHDQGDEGEIPALAIDTVDTLGAGDIFHGAFCHAFLETGSFVGALNIANGVAARSCGSSGTRSWMNA